MKLHQSIVAFERAQVSRRCQFTGKGFQNVGMNPVLLKKPKRPHHRFGWDQYIDCLASWGPMLFGHAHERILQAISDAAMNGTSFGAPSYMKRRWPNASSKWSLP